MVDTDILVPIHTHIVAAQAAVLAALAAAQAVALALAGDLAAATKRVCL